MSNSEMTIEEHLDTLSELQMELDKTLEGGRDSYAFGIVRPQLIKKLGLAVEKARQDGVTESDINDLVAVLELGSGRRPIELENFWDPRGMSKRWRK